MHAGLPAPGDVVWIRRRRWRVEQARRDRHVVRLDVASRDRRLTFLAPFDRPAAAAGRERPRWTREARARARLAHLLARAHGARTIASAVAARVDLLPHQLEPALAMATGVRRVLLADEVGLGKTIQAALIVAEVLRRGLAARVLLIVPAPLRDQWIRELDDRFRIACLIADRDGLEDLSRSSVRGDSPWQRAGVWIASVDFLKQPHVVRAMPSEPWDLLVIDEAHTVCGESARHDVTHALARRSRRVALLTATPHDGDEARFGRLLALGALPGEDEAPTVFRRMRGAVGLAGRRRTRCVFVEPSTAERRLLDTLQHFERAVMAAAGAGRRDAALILLSVFRKRALSSMAALTVTFERRLAWLNGQDSAFEVDWVQPRLGFDGADVVTEEDHDALLADVGLPADHERTWIRRLLTLADAARRRDGKVARVAALVARTPEAVVIFTEFRHSLEAMSARLHRLRPHAILHGGQTPAERRGELDRFLSGGVPVLLATDVASLGLNLQHRARWVMSLDVPWNPARLEQRAGRVDRIGQTRPVHVTMLAFRHPAEQRLLAHVWRRAEVARRALGTDMFDGTPTPAAMRAWVLEASPLAAAPPAAAATLATCRRWARPARWHARGLQRQRLFARRWQAPETALDAAPGICVAQQSAAWRRAVGPMTCVFTVPLVDGTGVVLERHVAAVRIDTTIAVTDARTRRVLVDAARRAAARAAEPRARALTRRVARLLARVAPREHALVAGIDERDQMREAQPGLFDDRDSRRFEAAQDEARARLMDRDCRSAESGAAGRVAVGRPSLELIFVSP